MIFKKNAGIYTGIFNQGIIILNLKNCETEK